MHAASENTTKDHDPVLSQQGKAMAAVYCPTQYSDQMPHIGKSECADAMSTQFEIASEETLKKSVYAADDRAAARSELEKLKTAYETAVQGSDGEEIRRRVGGRIRELERGFEDMEERALED
ncbi:MAG: hypothetical protein LQ350_005523 [Teloschistes chrysophthalmus]|nr:MAG: hypothetical protein LQ350_005523 [Niorma chrysophthalma]